MKRENNTVLLLMRDGKTTVETIATLLLLILLGVGLFSLSLSTVNAYHRLYEAKENATDLRVAQSYLSMKIRQNDRTGCLQVAVDPVSEKHALVAFEEIEGVSYATWVFHYNGSLYEALVLKDEAPSLEVAQAITRVDTFDIQYDEKEQGFFITLGKNGEQTIKTLLKTRTYIGEQF